MLNLDIGYQSDKAPDQLSSSSLKPSISTLESTGLFSSIPSKRTADSSHSITSLIEDQLRKTQPTVKKARMEPTQERTRKTRKTKIVLSDTAAEAKRAKFLSRNRIAASKCRQKRKEWATGLDNQVRELQMKRESLGYLTNSLKDEVLYLKEEMLRHSLCNYAPIKAYLHQQMDDIRNRPHQCSCCQRKPGEDALPHSPQSSASSLQKIPLSS